jgi:hypothetical protein
LPKSTDVKQMLRVMLGNFPPKSKCYLRAYCSQQLDFDDLSYCFRLPMSFIPSYMGDTGMYVNKGVSFNTAPVPANELTRRHQQDNLAEIIEFCT